MLKNLIAKLRSNSGQVDMTTANAGKSGAKDTTSQDSGTNKLDGLIQDVDFSDVPEEIRDSVKAKVAGKVRDYDIGFRSKTEDLSSQRKELETRSQQVAEIERIRGEIQSNPELETRINDLLTKARSGSPLESKKEDKNLNELDQLIQDTGDPQQRETLRQMRKIIKQETSAGNVNEEVKRLQEEIKTLKQSSGIGLEAVINNEMTKLESEYGKELIDKYKSKIVDVAKNHPNYLNSRDSWLLLHNIATKEEITNAVVESAAKKKQLELERKEQGTYASSTGSPSEVDLPRNKAGLVNWRDLIANMRAAGKFKL